MSDQVSKVNSVILSEALLSRSLDPKEQIDIVGHGRDTDMNARIAQYIKNYCNQNDDDKLLKTLCPTAPPAARINRDIDYTSLVNTPLTLNIDFTDTTLTNDEEDVLAMSRNLFNHNTMDTIGEDILGLGPLSSMGAAKWVYQNARSLQAVRGVAENSFAHIVGMKAKGGATVYPYMSEILQELGMPVGDMTAFLGANPSYFAQMDMLTKRIYTAPDFFVNLFTQPANVERMGATLQAIKLDERPGSP